MKFNRLTLLSVCFFCLPMTMQGHSLTAHEKLIRETYRKLETYNAAAQSFQKEQSGHGSLLQLRLRFTRTDVRAGQVQEIAGERYAELVTLPTGEIGSLTHGSHSLDQGAEEASFAAAWEHGQYASVFDPQWTITDVLNFEPARYYDIGSYTSYQVTVNLDGKSRTYRALALFHGAALRLPRARIAQLAAIDDRRHFHDDPLFRLLRLIGRTVRGRLDSFLVRQHLAVRRDGAAKRSNRFRFASVRGCGRRARRSDHMYQLES